MSELNECHVKSPVTDLFKGETAVLLHSNGEEFWPPELFPVYLC